MAGISDDLIQLFEENDGEGFSFSGGGIFGNFILTLDMIKKKQLLSMLQEFPEEFSVDDLLDRVILLSRIEKGMQQSQNGEVLSHEQANDRMNQWISRQSK